MTLTEGSTQNFRLFLNEQVSERSECPMCGGVQKIMATRPFCCGQCEEGYAEWVVSGD